MESARQQILEVVEMIPEAQLAPLLEFALYLQQKNQASATFAPLIFPRVRVHFHNMETMLRTFDPQAELFGLPLWKHAYHLLHSCDRWFINPAHYDEPPFHTPGLNSLDDPVLKPQLSREDLLGYLAQVRAKCEAHVEGLSDADWAQTPEDCPYSRIELLLGQFRHANAHLGNINAVTMQQTGKWPRVVGLEGDIGPELWE